MNLELFPYVLKNIVLRKYKDYNIYDLKNDESYIIDNEAYALLSLINGKKTNREIINSFPSNKESEIKKALEKYNEIGVIQFYSTMITDPSIITNEHITLPKKNPLNPPYLKNIMINITEKCNLTCKHCYITDKNPINMELEVLFKLIKEFYELQGIKIILTGGEPFLYSKLKNLLEELKDLPLQKVLLTNGTLIHEQDQIILDLLKENYFEVFVSIDGLESTHNDFRNSDCFRDTIKGIKILMDNNISVSINTMIHKQNLGEFDEIYKLITSLGTVKNWSIDIPTFDDKTPKDIREKYEISFKDGGEILKNYGWGVIYESSSEGEEINYACGPYMMAIDVKGKITKCGFFSEYNLGNVFDLNLKNAWEIIQKELNWNIKELKCAEIECEYLDNCRGGCRYRAYKQTNSIKGIDSFKCYQFGKIIK
ncbi:MAG: radical SAM protein [Candidatus Lokiarchaeota archaeon]|nr:radical SAM protein [Candidatus Lokiarchaeota archaeon]